MVTPAAPDSPRALPPAPTVIPVAVSSAQTSASPLDTVPLDALPSDIPNVQLHLDPGSINPVTAPHSFALANNALNLDTIERPLTYATALKGPNRLHWLNAEAEEFDRLFSTNTIKAIHAHEQPVDRRRDTTYYNPQTKEKPNRSGDTVYRIRGTIGGDRINYPGATYRNIIISIIIICYHLCCEKILFLIKMIRNIIISNNNLLPFML